MGLVSGRPQDFPSASVSQLNIPVDQSSFSLHSTLPGDLLQPFRSTPLFLADVYMQGSSISLVMSAIHGAETLECDTWIIREADVSSRLSKC